MAIKTYYYRSTAPTSALSSLLAIGASPAVATPATDNPFVAITVDDSNKPDLDEAMEALGFAFVTEGTPSDAGKIRLVTAADSPYTPGEELAIFADASAGPITISQPLLAGLTPTERQLKVQKVDASANAVTIANGVDTINGAPSFALTGQYDAAEIIGSALLATWALLLQPSGTPPPPTGVPVTTLVAGEPLVAGNVCAFDGSLGRVFKADATTSAGRTQILAVVKDASIATGVAGQFYTYAGSLVPVLFGVAPDAADNDRLVYLDTTSGLATLTAPTATGTAIVEIGTLQGGDGATTTPLVLFGPAFRSEAA